ncbi:hypothetical protein FQR65_LT20692 [Abscondita terminalis]|nr:hypothetical protein FQR65_LT20692 [Abscondita terminalis]
MFARGLREIPIYVQGEQDGVFSLGRIIDFGEPNTAGRFRQSCLYSVVAGQPEPHVQLFSAYIHYFLTHLPTGPYYTATTQDPFYMGATAKVRMLAGRGHYAQPGIRLWRNCSRAVTGGPRPVSKCGCAGVPDDPVTAATLTTAISLPFVSASADTSVAVLR